MNTALPRVASFALMISLALTATAQDGPNEIALIVNGEPIATWEIALLMPQVKAGLAAQGLDTKGEGVLKATLERAVDSRLLAQEARRRGVEPDAQRIDEKMAKLAEGAGGRAALEAELIKSGITYSQVRSTVVQADLVQSLVETNLGGDIEVTEAEIEAFYSESPDLFTKPDKVHSRNILIKVEEGATSAEKEAARSRAEAARKRALAGEDFAALAMELSDGPTAAQGGDLGYTSRGQMLETFDNVVWALEAGQISEVVESHLGYHVIKVEEVVIGPMVPLDEARPTVEAFLRQQRIGGEIAALITELRASAEIRDPAN